MLLNPFDSARKYTGIILRCPLGAFEYISMNKEHDFQTRGEDHLWSIQSTTFRRLAMRLGITHDKAFQMVIDDFTMENL